MKKDDIIGQKLFETCKLSEFYLNLIVNSRLTDDDSPFELAIAYKQKLYEIVERYDRLLETSAQREQLTLQFENRHHTSINNGKPPISQRAGAKTLSTTSTPNPSQANQTCQRVLTPGPGPSKIGGFNTPLNVSTSVMAGMNVSTCISQPTTPLQGVVSNCNSNTVSRSSSATNFSIRTYNKTRPTYLGRQAKITSASSSSSSSSSNHSDPKLEQRLAALYYDDYDENDDLGLTKSDNQGLKSNRDTDNEASNETYDDDMDDDVESNHSQNIEKSYSNLSKDSGVLADSYHSDYSNSNGLLLNGNTYFNGGGSQLDLADQQKLLATVTNKNNQHHQQINDECLSNFGGSTSSNDLSSEETTTTTTAPTATTTTVPPPTTNFALIKQSIDKKSSSQTYRTYTKSKKSLSYFSDSHQQPKKSNSNLSLSSISSSSNSSSTPSPGSSSSGIGSDTSCTTTTTNTTTTNNISLAPSEATDIAQQKSPQLQSLQPSNNPFFFNYNSLMNVSMLDSIQVTNNSLDLDNMSSSILMFN